MTNKISSLWQSYNMTLKIAGEQQDKLKKSYLNYILSYIFQGIAYALFYPLLTVMFEEKFILNDAVFYLTLICILSILSCWFKWGALNFNYTNELVEVTHNLRLKLGNKIKTMPLQRLNSYRTGELNSILAGNVDESVLPMGVVAGMFFEVLIIPLIIIITIFFIDIKMALVIIMVLPFSIPLYRYSRKLSKKEKSDNRAANATLESDIIEYVQGLPVLRSINQVGENSTRLQESILKVRKVQKPRTN